MRKAPHTWTVPGAYGEQLSFLPKPAFCPTWPKRNTLADKALRMLLDGQTIDHPDFDGACGSWRLGAVIFNLRVMGWPINTIPIAAPTDDCPQREIALYELPANCIAMALAMHQDAESEYVDG